MRDGVRCYGSLWPRRCGEEPIRFYVTSVDGTPFARCGAHAVQGAPTMREVSLDEYLVLEVMSG